MIFQLIISRILLFSTAEGGENNKKSKIPKIFNWRNNKTVLCFYRGVFMKSAFSEVKVEPSFKFHWVFIGAGLMHLTFLIAFACVGMLMMVNINIISILIYVTGAIVTRKGVSKHALAWIIAFFIEVMVHAVICTIIQGVEVSFFLYPLMGMPVYGYLLFGYCDRPTLIRASLFMAVTTFVAGFLTLGFVDHVGSVYTLTGMHEITRTELIVFRTINVTFATLMLMVFTLAFYMELSKLLKALNESNRQLDYIATHDALTGLSNRRSLWTFFDGLEKSGDHFCIILGDLDDFKKINDTYGHECGDIVLKAVSGIILEKTGDEEMACRWGGEEMLIVLRGSREECLKRVGEIKDLITSLGITQDERPVKVSMTFGFVCKDEVVNNSGEVSDTSTELPPAHLGLDNLISEVDKRLYVGKRSGKNVIIAA